MINKEQALCILDELIDSRNLKKHCLGVSFAMLAYCDYFGIHDPREREKWEIAGLLHDADWERYPQEHPRVILEKLKKLGAPEDLLNAIASHGFEFGIEPKTLMAKTLRAVDELVGFIVAVALIRPSKRLSDVSVDSVLKKWKEKSFARGVKREDIEQGAKELGVPLREHIEIVLKALQEKADNLGL